MIIFKVFKLHRWGMKQSNKKLIKRGESRKRRRLKSMEIEIEMERERERKHAC